MKYVYDRETRSVACENLHHIFFLCEIRILEVKLTYEVRASFVKASVYERLKFTVLLDSFSLVLVQNVWFLDREFRGIQSPIRYLPQIIEVRHAPWSRIAN
jgi:hypothetical protein